MKEYLTFLPFKAFLWGFIIFLWLMLSGRGVVVNPYLVGFAIMGPFLFMVLAGYFNHIFTWWLTFIASLISLGYLAFSVLASLNLAVEAISATNNNNQAIIWSTLLVLSVVALNVYYKRAIDMAKNNL